MADASRNSEILHDFAGVSRRATNLGISGVFVKFSWGFVEFLWDFCGSQSLQSKHLLTLGLLVMCGVFVHPLKAKLVALFGGLRGLFMDVPAPPAVENMCKPTAMESTEENIFLNQAPPLQPDSHVRGL